MRIAVDAMGGDYAPAEIVKGAVEAVSLYDGVEIILVGDQEAIEAHLPKAMQGDSRITIHHTPDCIRMEDCINTVRTRPQASVVLAAQMVKVGEADGVVSVGNTAAAMAVAALKLGRIPGIERPAIAVIMPSNKGYTLLLDAGATADCSVEQLVQFALMGDIYAERILKIDNPRVALLSIGEESTKGNEVTKATHFALKNTNLRFIGNVEGRGLFSGEADVVVADGFVGNVALKTAEGIRDFLEDVLKNELRSPMLALPMLFVKSALRRVLQRADYSEYGGAPLLGVNGVCIVGHGRSKAKAVVSAIRTARAAIDQDIINCIRDSLSGADSKPAVGE